MVQLLKKPKVNVVTKEGECEVIISLDLNVNLNINGTSVDVSAEEKVVKQDSAPFIPDFGVEKIKFGEKV